MPDYKRRTGSMPPMVGFGLVVFAHLVVIYALASGLARKVVEVVRVPVEALIIAEPPRPLPPELPAPPPPKLQSPPPIATPPQRPVPAPPPPAAIPAAEPPPVPAAPVPAPMATPAPAPTDAPPAPQALTPAPAPPVAAPPAPAPAVVAAPPPPAPAPPPVARPALASAGVACPNYKAVLQAAGFPVRAARAGLDKGVVVLRFTLGPGGKPQNVRAVRQSHPIFGRAAASVVAEAVVCDGAEGQDVETEEITYNAAN